MVPKLNTEVSNSETSPLAPKLENYFHGYSLIVFGGTNSKMSLKSTAVCLGGTPEERHQPKFWNGCRGQKSRNWSGAVDLFFNGHDDPVSGNMAISACQARWNVALLCLEDVGLLGILFYGFWTCFWCFKASKLD